VDARQGVPPEGVLSGAPTEVGYVAKAGDQIVVKAESDTTYVMALRIGLNIASALDCIHTAGIFHRDIKPHNILRADSGEYKLADFGLGKSEGSETITRVGEMIGTLRYLPPEGLEGQPMDHTCDLFQLGLVLYEIATGARPYRGSAVVEILRAYAKETPISPSKAIPDIPDPFDNLVFNLIEMKREDRYQDAASVLQDLARLEKNQTVRRRRTVAAPVPAPEKPSGPTTEVIPPVVPSGPKSAPTIGKTMPLRVLVPGGLFLFLGLLALKPSGPPDPVVSPATAVVADIVLNLTTRVGEKKILAAWSSRTAYRGVVEYGRAGSDVVTVAEEQGPTVSHSVTITELESGKDYRITVRPPAPAVAESRVVKLSPLKAQLTHAQADGGEGVLRWKTSHPTKASVEVQRFGRNEAFEVARSPRNEHEMRFSGIGAEVDFKLSLSLVNDVGESVNLDVQRLVEDRVAGLGPLPREEDLPGTLRKLAKSARMPPAVAKELARKILEERFAILRDLPAALPVIRYYLGNPIFPREPRLSLYRFLRTVQVLEALCSELGFGIEIGVKPDYPLSLSQLERPTVARDSVLPLEGLARPGAAGAAPGTIIRSSEVRLGSGPWAAAELCLTGKLSRRLYLEVTINGKQTLILLVPSPASNGDQLMIHRVPVELLKEGGNELRLRVRPLTGRDEELSQMTIGLRGELVLTRPSSSLSREVKVVSR
jgi:hypothetical protein